MRNVNLLGAALVVVGVLLSFCISIAHGFQMSKVWWVAALCAAFGFLAVGIEVMSANRMAYLWSARLRIRSVAMLACLLGAAAVNVTMYEMPFISTVFETLVAGTSVASDNAKDLKNEKVRLEAQAKAAGVINPRPLQTVEAELTAIESDSAFRKSRQCSYPYGETQTELCEKRTKAIAEKGAAAGIIASQARIAEINRQLGEISEAGVGDAGAKYLADSFGTTLDQTRRGMVWGCIILLRLVTVLLPFVSFHASAHPEARSNEGRREEKTQTAVVTRKEAAPAPEGTHRIELKREAIQAAAAQISAAEPQETEKEESACANGAVPFVADVFHAPALPAPSPETFDLEQALGNLSNTARRPALDAVADLPEIPETDKRKRISDDVRRYISDCLITKQDESDCERAMNIRAGYEIWARNLGKEVFSPAEFGSAMTEAIKALGGDKRKHKGLGLHYFGCKFRPAWAQRIANHASKEKANGKALVKSGEKFLGISSPENDSMARIEIRA